jgi:asparagine synthase (glutamine-hydrolysing)
MIWHNDEPLNFANSIQIYAISKLARENVTVVLTGEGADELFGGYPRYYIPKLAAAFRAAPKLLSKTFLAAIGHLGDHRVDKIKRFAEYSENETLLFNSGFLDRDFFGKIAPGLRLPALAFRNENLAKTENSGFDDVSRLSLLDQQTYLVSILNRQDKMSMAASIESRVPLLDYRIVELANRMPSHYKMKLMNTKIALKKMAFRYLPGEIINRKKSGFGVPLEDWFRKTEGMGCLVQEIMDEIKMDGLVDQKSFAKLVSDHMHGRKDYSDFIWTHINFCMWKKVFSISIL